MQIEIYDIGNTPIVYSIENIQNGKCYIGSTLTGRTRLLNHIGLLRNNKHHSIHLQRAYNLHGAGSFKIRVLENCSSSDLIVKEQYYIDLLKPDYNIKPNAYTNLGYKPTKKDIRKGIISKNLSIFSMDKTSNILKRFISTGAASRYYKLSINSIRHSIKSGKCCKKGYAFCYQKDYVKTDRTAKPVWNKGKKVNLNKNRRSLFIFKSNGEYIKKVSSLKEAAAFCKSVPPNVHRKINKIPVKFFKKGMGRFLFSDNIDFFNGKL